MSIINRYPYPGDIGSQIDDLRLLKDGWLNGEGKAPPEDGLEWLTQSFDRHYPSELPCPYIYPTEEGGVQAEFVFSSFASVEDLEVRIDLLNRQATYIWMDAASESTLDLADEAGWNRLSSMIRQGCGIA